MKKCVKCGKENEGNFCVYCGGKLEEERIEKNTEQTEKKEDIVEEKVFEEKKNVNNKNNIPKNNIWMYATIGLIILIVIMGGYFILKRNEIKDINDEVTSLKSQITKLKKEKSELEEENFDYLMENSDYEDKANFLDKNIVFVLEGYGNYYYTYDQVQQVTQGNEFTYWAYNKEAAISKGYKPFK